MTIAAGRMALATDDLRRAGLPLEGVAAEDLWLDTLPGVTVRHETAALRLWLDVPPSWLPAQHVGNRARSAFTPALSSLGALFNYDVYGRRSNEGWRSLSSWSELRLFGPFGVLSTTSVDQRGTGSTSGYVRHDTHWRYTDEQRALTWEAGDLVTRGTTWGSTVRLGGLQLSRNFAVRPDIVTYPLPQFSGEAAVATTVELFINGHRADSANVQPGPFTFTNVPFINGAGQAVMTVTDALGRQTSTTLPFYVSGELLRPGLVDFSLALGRLRQRYGVSNFAYGELAASASGRYGLSDSLTVEARSEVAGAVKMAGAGVLMRLGTLGVMNAAWSSSDAGGRHGWQFATGYRYNARRFSVSAQHARRSHDFSDLATIGRAGGVGDSRTTSATASVQLPGSASLGAGLFDVAGRNRQRTRLANLSFGKPVGRSGSLHASANRELDTRRWSATLQLVTHLGGQRGSTSASLEHDQDQSLRWRTAYQRALPSHGGFGWSAAMSEGSGSTTRRGQVDIAWRGRRTELRAGMHGSRDAHSHWANASGSLVMMDGKVLPANRIADAFVLVSTDGQPEVPVRYENQLVGRSNASGHLLVPWAAAHYAGRYSIETLELPVELEAPVVEQRVSVRAGSGYKLSFPVRRISAAGVVLQDASGASLPVGSVLRVNDHATAYVGWDGFAYLEGLASSNIIVAQLPEGGECIARFTLADEHQPDTRPLGPLSCR